MKKPNSSEMCPPGFHVVKGHERVCHSGIRTWVDAHVWKNPGRKFGEGLLLENLLYLYWNSKKKYPPLRSIYGFKKKGAEFDTAIQFWLDFWEAENVSLPKINPLVVKALIAYESSFDPLAYPKSEKSSAFGSMQVNDQARRVLAGIPNSDGWQEVKSDLVSVSKSDIADPVANIAVGIRWLGHKYSKIPKGAKKNLRNILKNYHSWDEAGDDYANRVLNLYEKSK